MFHHYRRDLSLPDNYNYLYGNPVLPVVPLQTMQKRIFIIGAYPSARFRTIEGIRDIPVDDNLEPFTTERYFDGSRVRNVDSGIELEQNYLRPLGLTFQDCWITDLVKVFLFKPGHIKKYRQLGIEFPRTETRGQFEQHAQDSLPWLEKEIQLAEPKLIITLGSEVAGILQHVRGRKSRHALLKGDVQSITIAEQTHDVVHLAHPGIVMRSPSETNQWPKIHMDVHIPAAREVIQKIL